MKAMVFDGTGPRLKAMDMADPQPGPGEILLDVRACGVCRTDLHLVDAELPDPKRPVIPGHEIVGVVSELGEGVRGIGVGDRVGVPWLGRTCRHCRYCLSGRENLCDSPDFTGYTIDGGYAQRVVANAGYCLHLPERYGHTQAAPLLCAGLIGYRTLAMAGNAQAIGLYGFGAAAHIIAQVALHQGREVYAFTRPGDDAAQQLARHLGVTWAGGSDQMPPTELDAALIFAPVGSLVPAALRATAKGGSVVCGGIHMSAIPSFPYADLWGERRIQSVANLTRADGEAFMKIADACHIDVATTCYPLADANRALDDLRSGRVAGAAVLTI